MILVLAFCKVLTVAIVLGLFLGSIISFLNFLCLNIFAYKAVEKSEESAKRYMKKAYFIRYFSFALIFIFVIKSGFINMWTFLIPMIGPKLYFLLIYSFLNRKEGK